MSNPPPELSPLACRPAAPRAPLPVRRPPPPVPAAAKSVRPKAPGSVPPPPAAKSVPPPPPKSVPPKPPAAKPPAVQPQRESGVDFEKLMQAPDSRPPLELEAPSPAPLPQPEAEPERGGRALPLILALLAGGGLVAFAVVNRDAPPDSVATVDPPDRPSEVSSAVEDEPEPEPEVSQDPEVDPEAEPEAEPDIEELEPEPVLDRQPVNAVSMRPQPRNPTTDAEPAEEPEPAPRPTMQPVPEPEENLPAQPTREQVQAALSAVRPAIAACIDGHGRIPVRVTIMGSGRVTTAVVEDTFFARPPTGSCIARAVRTARFPRFSDDRLVVLYPFQI